MPESEYQEMLTMTQISPKPIISRTVQTWRVSPGMTFALVEDVEHRVWIVESCPAGTHFWTLAQAQQLPQGARTREALKAAIQAGRELEREAEARKPARKPARREALPSYDIPTRYALPLDRQRRTTRARQTVATGKSLVTV
jgi:hypothetical protein